MTGTPAPKLIVWDFDGVLNANMKDGRFVWADTLQADLGIDARAFSDHLFASGLMRDVICGRQDLHKVVTDWLADQGHAVTAQAFMDYWFEKDALPDPQVIEWVHAHPARHVIGTNNEGHRARYIETTMGFGALVSHIFASGRMGVAKPDIAYFEQIEAWSGHRGAEILLIDDTARNIEAAQGHGWQAFLFNDATRADLPDRLGLT